MTAPTERTKMKTETLPAERIQTAETPMQMLGRMVDAGADPDQLGKMMDLAERYEAGEAKKAFASAMAAAQNEMPTVIKDKQNGQTRSTYASMEQVQSTIKPVYIKHGLTVSFGEVPHPREDWLTVEAIVRHRDGHEERYYESAPIDTVGPKGNAVKTGLHGSQSSRTYLQRTLLCAIFSVTVADQDMDGNNPLKFVNQEQAEKIAEMLADLDGSSAGPTAAKVLASYKVPSITRLPGNHFESIVKKLSVRLLQKGGAE